MKLPTIIKATSCLYDIHVIDIYRGLKRHNAACESLHYFCLHENRFHGKSFHILFKIYFQKFSVPSSLK